MKLSSEVIDKLRKAIDAAQRPGDCHYVDNLKPCCIVGQFAYLQGITVDELIDWQSAVVDDRAIPDLGVDKRLLRELQVIWDNVKDNNRAYLSFHPEVLRAEMHARLNRWIEECPFNDFGRITP